MNYVNRQIKTLGLFILMATACMLPVLYFQGCATKLDSAGVYAQPNGGGMFLFTVDKTLVDSKETLYAFVNWELQNRPTIPPAVTKAADTIRDQAPLWFTNAYNLRAAYVTLMNVNSPQTITASNNLASATSLISAQATAASALKK